MHSKRQLRWRGGWNQKERAKAKVAQRARNKFGSAESQASVPKIRPLDLEIHQDLDFQQCFKLPSSLSAFTARDLLHGVMYCLFLSFSVSIRAALDVLRTPLGVFPSA